MADCAYGRDTLAGGAVRASDLFLALRTDDHVVHAGIKEEVRLVVSLRQALENLQVTFVRACAMYLQNISLASALGWSNPHR